jgi:hypothetical protein
VHRVTLLLFWERENTFPRAEPHIHPTRPSLLQVRRWRGECERQAVLIVETERTLQAAASDGTTNEDEGK